MQTATTDFWYVDEVQVRAEAERTYFLARDVPNYMRRRSTYHRALK